MTAIESLRMHERILEQLLAEHNLGKDNSEAIVIVCRIIESKKIASKGMAQL